MNREIQAMMSADFAVRDALGAWPHESMNDAAERVRRTMGHPAWAIARLFEEGGVTGWPLVFRAARIARKCAGAE
jgi:hypothetical protein